jgi:hypothetical protein
MRRASTLGTERYPYIIWFVCNIDLYALISGAGTGEFLKAMLENNMLPDSKSQLYPLASSGYSVIYPEENATLPHILQLYYDTFVLASRLAFLASELRDDKVCYDTSSPTAASSKWLYEIRGRLQQLWNSADNHYLCQHMESLPQRSCEVFQNVSLRFLPLVQD